MFANKKLKNINQLLLITLFLTIPAMIVCSDYNGNILSPSKIIFNTNSSNSYIQSTMQKTVNFDGLIDQTFGTLGSMYFSTIAPASSGDICNSIAIQTDGKIVMGGYTLFDDNYRRFAATRLNPDGSPDVSFGNNGLVYLNPIAPGSNNDLCNSIAIQPDGKIVMGGYTFLTDAGYRFAAARLTTNGLPDITFGGTGSMYLLNPIAPVSNGDECNSIALQADGKIVMGGYTFLTDAGYRFAAARLNADGFPDVIFGSSGSMYFLNPIALDSATDQCNSIKIQTDGKIVMGGITAVDYNNRFAAARLTTDGSLDTTFGSNGSVYLNRIATGSTNDECNSIALQADDKIVMGGFTKLDNTSFRFAAARLNVNGSPDTTFGDNGSIYLEKIAPNSTNEFCLSIAIQKDGKIIMGGSTDGSTNNRNSYRNFSHGRFAIARLLLNGQLDPSFAYGGTLCLDRILFDDESCNAIALQSNGKIVMGGYTNDTDHKYHFAAAQLINPITLQGYQESYATVGAGIYS